MKTDWKVGDKFIYATNRDNDERGTLAGKVNIGQKYDFIEFVGKDFVVSSDGWVFYFDEIKPIIKVKGQLA